RSIPRKGGSAGSRIVEVVWLPAKGMVAEGAGPRPADSRVRAQTWDDGFPARAAAASALPTQLVKPEAPAPVVHVMSRVAPATDEVASASPARTYVEDQAGRVDQS